MSAFDYWFEYIKRNGEFLNVKEFAMMEARKGNLHKDTYGWIIRRGGYYEYVAIFDKRYLNKFISISTFYVSPSVGKIYLSAAAFGEADFNRDMTYKDLTLLFSLRPIL